MSELLRVENLFKTFRSRGSEVDDVRALVGVDLVVQRQDHWAVVGGSGSGKTTLAKVLMGLVQADQGQVFFEGQEAFSDRDTLRDLRRRMRMVFQDPFASLDPRFSIYRVLAEALCLEGKVVPEEARAKMCDVLVSVGLSTDVLGRYPYEFSGGERQRISIARALMTEPSLLVLDEAISALDMIVQKEVLDVLSALKRARDVTYIFISHDLRAVRKLCQNVMVMCQGCVVEQGPIESVLNAPKHAYTQCLLKAALDYRSALEEAWILEGELQDTGSGHWVRI